MISLYPSHIHISFPCPYISHIHKSFIIFAGCPATCVFFIFHFCGMKTGCVFLVIFWCWCCGWFSLRPSSRFSSRFSFRFSVRSSFRSSLHSVARFAFRFAPRPVFSVSFFAPPFAQPLVSFVRLGVSGGRFVGTRRFVLLVWGWRAFVFFFVSWCRGGNREGGACRVVDGVGFADVVSWASVRDESDAVRRGVGRVARRGVGRGVVAFVGYGNYATNGRTMGQRRIGNGRRDDVR